MALEVGQKAPDFTLMDTNKNEITLSDHRGENVVLLFFPFAFSGDCTKELCNIEDSINKFDDLNAKVYGISVDAFFSLAAFKESMGINYELLSDFNKEVAPKYDSLFEQFPVWGLKGVTKRTAFVVDPEGNIAYKEICTEPGQLPNNEAIKGALK